jgi:hypothetical protein
VRQTLVFMREGLMDFDSKQIARLLDLFKFQASLKDNEVKALLERRLAEIGKDKFESEDF